MLNRRELLSLIAFAAGGLWAGADAAAVSGEPKKAAAKLKTVTLAISGMT